MRDFYSSVLHNKGYFGLSARNSADNIRTIDLNVVKVLNQDPNAYRDDSKDLENQELKATGEPLEQQVYTDDLEGDAVDVVEKYENEIRRQTEYMKKNIGNIGGSDNYNQKLYKMIGQIKHVNQRLQDFLD